MMLNKWVTVEVIANNQCLAISSGTALSRTGETHKLMQETNKTQKNREKRTVKITR